MTKKTPPNKVPGKKGQLDTQAFHGEIVTAEAKAHKLNPAQERFCREYIQDFNATQAAIRAGYSKKTAGSQGHALLKHPEIGKYIGSLVKPVVEEVKRQNGLLNLDFFNIVDRAARIATGNLADFLAKDENGRLYLSLEQVDREDIYALDAIEITNMEPVLETEKDEDGATVIKPREVLKTKIKIGDRLKALELLAKLQGMMDGNTAKDIEAQQKLPAGANDLTLLARQMAFVLAKASAAQQAQQPLTDIVPAKI